MLEIKVAREEDIPRFQDLSRKYHLLRRKNIEEGFLYVINSEFSLKQIIKEGLSKTVKFQDEIVGYILINSGKGYGETYDRELSLIVENNYHSYYDYKSAIILQVVLDKSIRRIINSIRIQNQIIGGLFKKGFRTVYAEGCLNPFNPRTYYLLSEMCGWKREGFKHERLEDKDYENDPEEISALGGIELMKKLLPQGIVFGLYSKHKIN